MGGGSGSFSRGHGGRFDRDGRYLPDSWRSTSGSLKAQRNNTAARLSPEREARVLDFALKLELAALKPAPQLLLCPIATRDEKPATLLHQRLDLLPVSLTYPAPLGIFLLRQANGVECALIQYNIEAR